MTALEVAVTSVAGARTAMSAGADRVELCSALELGGVTPSAGLLAEVLEVTPEVHVLVRPRLGDFRYDADEIATAVRDVLTVVGAGARGVVVGALRPNGLPDLDVLRRLSEPARAAGATVTFHRAVDQSSDIRAAVGALAASELVDRVLTSGGATAVGDALDVLTDLVRAGVAITAGGGVAVDAVPALAAVGVEGIHLSAKRRVAGTESVTLGSAAGGDHFVTDAAIVRSVATALRG